MHRKYEINCQVLFGDHHVVPFANGDFLLRYSSVDSLQPNRLWFMVYGLWFMVYDDLPKKKSELKRMVHKEKS